MSLMSLSLILSGLLSLPAAADPSPAADTAAPALVHLDQQLTAALQEKAQGRLAADRYAEFLAKFKIDLAATKTAVAPTSANETLYAKIQDRLRETASASITSNVPRIGGIDIRSAQSRAHFADRTNPAVIAEEKAVLASEPFKGSRNDSGDLPVAAGSRRSPKIRFVSSDADTLPIEPIVKIKPAGAPPSLSETPSPKEPSPLPLVPLTVAAGLGAAAYGVSKSKSAYVSEDGHDDPHAEEISPLQRLVGGTIVAGIAGGLLYLVGGAVVTAVAPVALRYAAPAIEQGVRLAGSEAGSLNPVVDDAAPEVEESAAEIEQVVLERSERGLHLFKYKDATSTAATGWSKGDRFLYLSNQGSPAANWAQNSRVLRIAMRAGKPIFDSYVDELTGKQIPTTGFLKAERNLLETHGWIFNPQTGAYHPPTP